jgi:hypothetical protein
VAAVVTVAAAAAAVVEATVAVVAVIIANHVGKRSEWGGISCHPASNSLNLVIIKHKWSQRPHYRINKEKY